MTIIRIILFTFSLSVLVSCQSNGQEVKVMTYNIRLDVESDAEDAWPFRKDFLISQIQFYEPDFLGVQEARPNQMTDMSEKLHKYDYIGHGRDGGAKGEYSAIFYNKNKYQVLDQATFWLSNTPDTLSMGWDAAYPRICTYGLFKDKESGKMLWVVNTHLDHVGKEAQVQGINLILSKLKKLNTKDYPIVLMGDFNVEPDSHLIANLSKSMSDTESIAKVKLSQEGTFNGFQMDEPVSRVIDYIFISKSQNVLVHKYAILSANRNLRYPSDHFPVFVELELR